MCRQPPLDPGVPVQHHDLQRGAERLQRSKQTAAPQASVVQMEPRNVSGGRTGPPVLDAALRRQPAGGKVGGERRAPEAVREGPTRLREQRFHLARCCAVERSELRTAGKRLRVRQKPDVIRHHRMPRQRVHRGQPQKIRGERRGYVGARTGRRRPKIETAFPLHLHRRAGTQRSPLGPDGVVVVEIEEQGNRVGCPHVPAEPETRLHTSEVQLQMLTWLNHGTSSLLRIDARWALGRDQEQKSGRKKDLQTRSNPSLQPAPDLLELSRSFAFEGAPKFHGFFFFLVFFSEVWGLVFFVFFLVVVVAFFFVFELLL
mmetsp:Transcript_3847/g.5869  ORF Transcript_3847/g.5869 Transcript_3847/m.5869 type:complete len:316 (+) Transcript_3847:836-1783(+)